MLLTKALKNEKQLIITLFVDVVPYPTVRFCERFILVQIPLHLNMRRAYSITLLHYELAAYYKQ